MIIGAVILIAVLVLVFLIVKWRNLPAVIEQRRLAAEAAAKRQADRQAAKDLASKARQDARTQRQLERQQRRQEIFRRPKK